MKLISIESSKTKWLDLFVESYVEKINHYQKFEVIYLKSVKVSRDDFDKKKNEESLNLLKRVQETDYVILFDEKGKVFDSRKFSERIQRLQTTGQSRITFVIGGAFGVNNKMKERAQETWSLSSLVMNHHLALAVSLEQIYRAFAIIKNKPYHND